MFISFIIVMLGVLNHVMIRFVASTMLLCYYIIINMFLLHSGMASGELWYSIPIRFVTYSKVAFEGIVIFVIEDTIVSIISDKYKGTRVLRVIALVIWITQIIYLLFGGRFGLSYLVDVLIYFVYLYPSVFLLLNLHSEKGNFDKSLKKVAMLALVNIGFLCISKYIVQSLYTDVFVYLMLVELFLMFEFVKSTNIGLLEISRRFAIDMAKKIVSISIGLGIIGMINGFSIKEILSYSIGCTIILKIFDMCLLYIRSESVNFREYYNSRDLAKGMIGLKIGYLMNEENYQKYISDFLHDDILQDVIYVERELKDIYGLGKDSRLILALDKIIYSLREKMNYVSTGINIKKSIYENCRDVQTELKQKYSNRRILVDFVCEEKLFIPNPYSSMILRLIKEMTTNIYKHSKGNFSIVELIRDGDEIILNVENYGDEYFDIYDTPRGHLGIKNILKDIEVFGGSITVNKLYDPLENEEKIVIKVNVKIDENIVREYSLRRK